MAYARPNSEDLALLLLTNELKVATWFRPRENELVIDLGANVGAYTLRAASAGARVVAVEPNRDTMNALRANVALNGFGDVELLSTALSDYEGNSLLHIPPVLHGQSSLLETNVHTKSETVKVTKLDSLLRFLPMGASVDWLKIDVEGSELSVIKDGLNVISRTRHIIIEVSKGNEGPCKDILLNKCGFKLVDSDKQKSCEYWLLTKL